jgi:hypothetical protein
MPEHVTIKIWIDTKRLAKLVSAILDEPLVSIFHRLIVAEAKRLGVNPEKIMSSHEE